MATWILTKEFRFEASHQLMHHDGKCAHLHGHSFCGRVNVSGHALQSIGPKRGMVLDYADLSSPIKEMVSKYLDHHHLNETLETDSPTSEMIAKWVYDYMTQQLIGFPITSVEIEETCTSRCTYIPDGI